MKIVQFDNFDRDHISDVLVAENVPEIYAKIICEFLIEKHSSEVCGEYFKVVPDDYELYEFES